MARVDRALKDDLDIPEGLAAENVYVLDPCCGTGAYLAEVLRRIAANLEGRGLGALVGARVKQAATERVFGFEIMPAPFVVAHLQVGLTMQSLDAPLADDGAERASIFLTNALTGWEPTEREKQLVAFPEMAAERDRANRVKRDRPILVILGNPPYNGFAGVAVDEEQAFLHAYRTSKRVRIPDNRALHDLYIRFFRMAERRIAEKTGRGVVCFISNYSWLDGRSFAGMRERYLDVFDKVRIDNLHGDRIISEYAPDGRTSETIFALRGQSPGIKVGTGIALLSRSGSVADGSASGRILYRDFHQARADERRQALLESLDSHEIDTHYSALEPNLRLGLPFKPMAVSERWFDWPALSDLFPVNFSGINTNRDGFVIDDGISCGNNTERRPNLSATAQRYLDRLGACVEDLFHHVLATLHDPAYREANAGALRMEWPRIPLPGWPDGETAGAAETLAESAARGRELARLLDSDAPVPGVTQGVLRPELAVIAVPATAGGRNMTGDDFVVTAGWGHHGQGDAVMPGQGRATERTFTPEEREAMGDALPALGDTTFDIHLNRNAFWRNVPAAVWSYRLGGYQVLKKWLSYRERTVLGRPLRLEEIQQFTDTARRIAAMSAAVTPKPS